MMGILPAYGLFCRHVRGLTLSNIRISTAAQDLRHAIVCDDVVGLNVTGLQASADPEGEAVLRFDGVREALVHGCRAPYGAPDTAVRIL